MRILMTTAHATLLDGVNRHIQVLAPAIAKVSGVELWVSTCLPRGELHDVLEREGVKTCSLGVKSIRSVFLLFQFCALLLRFRPDVVHIEMPVFAEYLAVHLVRCFGCKARLIETIHGIGGSAKKANVRPSRRTKLYAWFRKRHDGIVFISKGVAQARNGMNAVETFVYNPMNFSDAHAPVVDVRSVLGVSSDVPVIGTACRIAAVKRPDCFVRVMLKVLEALPEAHAVVLGDGDPVQMNRMRELVQASGLESRFHLLGYRSDAKQLIASFSCFVMTSYREGMPTALLEAMSQKVPVAFWKGEGGLDDLAELNAKEGPIAIVREQDDEAGLASAIVAALKSPETLRENANRAFEVCRKIFDVESIAQQTVAFYRKVCAK